MKGLDNFSKFLLTALMRESKQDAANADPQAKGCVMYSGISGSSSSSWSRNATLLSISTIRMKFSELFTINRHNIS